ncbi:TetR/AcrR family transcriptional regulator [Nocardia gamkensis]|uniref:TetR family transcriptional regulator n=1 Tax=Nocardia gamkensis TaxID=352869 RepID=A0A7X6R6T2_9NOCA|nr:TetR/AcrR family transcriptional regulator [Nocardia gamkensis]NKY30879.1 TetR family transcriptional regulator [Nocardia gamkensis]NQE72113.1 HTH-type transcriptional regulator TcmR [Nocardia gamkensis]
MTGVNGPREREKTRVRRELVEAALRLFELHGFEQTTVQQIADAAQVSRRTFHRHFPSKLAVVFSHEEDLMAQLLAAVDRRPVSESVLTALRAALRDFLLDEQEAPARHRQADTARRARQLLVGNPELRRENFIGALGRQRAIALNFAARAGLPDGDLRPQLTAAACFAAFGVGLDHWMMGADHSIPALHRILDRAVASLQQGIDIQGAG